MKKRRKIRFPFEHYFWRSPIFPGTATARYVFGLQRDAVSRGVYVVPAREISRWLAAAHTVRVKRRRRKKKNTIIIVFNDTLYRLKRPDAFCTIDFHLMRRRRRRRQRQRVRRVSIFLFVVGRTFPGGMSLSSLLLSYHYIYIYARARRPDLPTYDDSVYNTYV